MDRIYLDHTNATPLDPRVLRAMLPHLRGGALNPSASHSGGRMAREVLEEARSDVSTLLGCREDEILFTSSATEANNLALKGVCRARGRSGSRLLVGAIEHPSVLHPAHTLAAEGMQVQQIPVDECGRLRLEKLSELLDGDVTMVSVAHGNPEVGTLQPIREIAARVRQAGALFHSDATVTAGHYPGLWRDSSPDLMTLSPSLFHGPSGIAALVIREGVRLRPQQEGGTQEGGRRAGTEPVPLLAGFSAAARLASREGRTRASRLHRLQEELRRRLEEGLPDWVPTGEPVVRVPGHLSLCLRYVEGEAVLAYLDDRGIQAGSGSACSREISKESHVLKAMGVDPVLARGAIQFGLGAGNTEDELAEVARVLPVIVEKLRRISPFGESSVGARED